MNYKALKQQLQKIADIGFASAVLSWDQETYMPPKGAAMRAQQLSTLAGVAHKLFTNEDMGKILTGLHKDESLNERERKNVLLCLEEFEKQKRYSTEFVEEMSYTVSVCMQAWQQAKEKKDFSLYAPHLEKLINLKRKECEIIGYKKHPYDALLDQHEKGMTAAELDKLFQEVKKGLQPLVKKITTSAAISDQVFHQHYPKSSQWEFGLELLKQMGFDFEAGRQDISSHPFTIHFNNNDVRITTRINENNLSEMVWSCIHEGGHGLYEQGLPNEEYGLPLGESTSLGIHESQSRLWENNIGRSLNYWKNNLPLAKKYFPEQLRDIDANTFYKACNKVKSSLIRTNADELTYHFHIIIRFEIEKALIEDKVKIAELPGLWNSKYKEYLNLDVPDDASGILQDVHWSHGSFGYFPTYSIGSFYAAQFYTHALKQIPDLEQQLINGKFSTLLTWLRKNIHQHGKMYTSSELCEKITGEKLNFNYFLEYARKKYAEIYNISFEEALELK